MRDHVGQLRERNAIARAVVGGARDIDQDPVDHLGIVAQVGRQPQRDIEELFAFHHLRESFAADGRLHDLFDVGDVDAMPGAELAVDLDLEIGLADDVENADVLDAPDTSSRYWRCAGRALPSVCRSVPMILTELAPLTPERASSTLSRMYCEKLKLIAGELPGISPSAPSRCPRG